MKHAMVRQCLVMAVAMLLPVMASASAPAAESGADMLGFTRTGTQHERVLEKRFDALLSAHEMRDWMKRLASGPNQVGSPHNKDNAEWLLAKFKAWGWDAHIEKFDVRYPTPKRLLVELVAPTRFKAKLHEPPIKGDRTSALSGVLPPYNSGSADGDVTAPLVYVNYGKAQDYERLAKLGISVKGKIVIVRYGRGFRGGKAREASRHGAVGCIIYSDPYGNGYFAGDMYPKGAMRPPEGVQRGNLGRQRIPVLPISSADATPLLKALGGPVAPKKWRGALPFTYHVGPGEAKVHMVVESNHGRKPIYNVIAKLPGSTDADQWVVRGNHHDAWVFGAFDPLAGTVALMGEAKALGTLYKQGWRPRRTLVYASWDAEEPGLVGSRAWAVKHARELKKNAVLYLNTDTNSRGFFGAGGSTSLEHMVNQVADSVADPETGVSVGARQRAHILMNNAGRVYGPRTRAAARDEDIPLRLLGSGSDYGTFLHRLGIASLSIRFKGEGQDYSVYHSRYDSFDHFIRFGDPTFEYEVALAKVAGHIMLRTANAKVVPVRFDGFSKTLTRYVRSLHRQVKRQRRQSDRKSGDSRMPELRFARLDESVKQLARSAQAYRRAYHASASDGFDIPADHLRELNQLIGTIGQSLMRPSRKRSNPLGRNAVMAGGGYSGKVFPRVYRSLKLRNWSAAERHARAIADKLDVYRGQLVKATELLQP